MKPSTAGDKRDGRHLQTKAEMAAKKKTAPSLVPEYLRALMKRVQITGFKGFVSTQTLDLGLPNSKPGSGLTILTGENGGGKTTIIDAFHWLQHSDREATQLPSGFRNSTARGTVRLLFEDANGRTAVFANDGPGVGEVKWIHNELKMLHETIFIVSSSRILWEATFQPYQSTRASHAGNTSPGGLRRGAQGFGGRLTRMNANHQQVDALLAKLLDHVPSWSVEPADGGNLYLKLYGETGSHGSEGLWEGFVNLLFIADALYDSSPGDIIVIDEPESSLHPQVQRRLSSLLAQFATDRQIIYATHSPYFVDWQAIKNGARLSRVFQSPKGARIASIQPSTITRLTSLLADNNKRNPHVLGLDASEIFFLNDGIVLVEGQEDVVGYRIIAHTVGLPLAGEFYGWGVGGAGNIRHLAHVLRDLGFTRVVGILDSDQQDLAASLTADFAEFTFILNPLPDVRTKTADVNVEKQGLLDSKWRLPRVHEEIARDLLTRVNQALASDRA